jgi:hypothetical protein
MLWLNCWRSVLLTFVFASLICSALLVFLVSTPLLCRPCFTCLNCFIRLVYLTIIIFESCNTCFTCCNCFIRLVCLTNHTWIKYPMPHLSNLSYFSSTPKASSDWSSGSSASSTPPSGRPPTLKLPSWPDQTSFWSRTTERPDRIRKPTKSGTTRPMRWTLNKLGHLTCNDWTRLNCNNNKKILSKFCQLEPTF